MLPRRVGKLIVLGCVAVAAGGVVCRAQGDAGSTVSQQTSLSKLRLDGGTVKLDGPWQFHLGDDGSWANPGFDDSAWEQLTADAPWGAQGHPSVSGFAWYRRHIALSTEGANPETLAILIPAVEDAYEVYWNGERVGEYGHLPPHPSWYFNLNFRPRTFALGTPQAGVLAVRVWKAPFGSEENGRQGGFYAPPTLGSQQSIDEALAALNHAWLKSEQFSFALNSLYALVALLGFLAWMRDRRQWLLFWMAVFAASEVLSWMFVSLKIPLPAVVTVWLFMEPYTFADISLWYLLIWLLGLRDRPRVLKTASILAWIVIIVNNADGAVNVGFALPNPSPYQVLDGVCVGIAVVADLFVFYLIGVAVFRARGLGPARWLVALFAFLTQMKFALSWDFAQGSRFTHWTLTQKLTAPLFTVFDNAIDAQKLFGAFLLIALVYAVYQYSAESSNRQTAMEQEYRNARAVQQVLIPEEIPTVPGFKIHAVYKPFGEVGGDFFQIIPLSDGAVLIAIGDVSGKGMPAAMLVSLLVGALHALAKATASPARLLAGLNQSVQGRSRGGFTTCLILHIGSDGSMKFANAGHISPYRRGMELDCENGLPLGLLAETDYRESTLQLDLGDQLTLLTDGVLEARGEKGELFGFERTAGCASGTAEAIAAAAQAFGQNDDITVLTVVRSAAVA